MGSDKLRLTIPGAAARAGVRPGTKGARTTTAPGGAPSAGATSATDKKVAALVQQGNVAVFKVDGAGPPIYATSQAQARAEAERRGLEGELVYQGYVKLSETDRARLQEQVARLEQKPGSKDKTQQKSAREAARDAKYPTPAKVRALSQNELRTLYDTDRKTASMEARRRGLVEEWFYTEDGGRDFQLRTPRAKESAEIAGEGGKSSADTSAFSAEDRAFIESRGGVIGVISEAEAAKMEASSKSNATAYAQPSGSRRTQVVTDTERDLPSIVADGGIGIWHVYDENTATSYKVEAVDRAQAQRIAKQQGMKPSNIYAVAHRDLTDKERERVLTTVGRPGTSKSLEGEFEELTRVGAIEPGAQFVRESFNAKAQADIGALKWSYIPADVVRAQKALEKYRQGEGFNVISAIADGVSDATFAKANFNMDEIRMAREWVKRHEEVIGKLQPYWNEPDPTPDPGDPASIYARPGYDIDKALKDGAVQPKDLLDVGFSREDIFEATERVSSESWPVANKHEQFQSELVKGWERQYPEATKRLQEAGVGFSIDTLLKIDRELKGDIWVEGDRKPTAEKVLSVLEQAEKDGVRTPSVSELWRVWHEGASEYKSWVLGLPKEHPEKKALGQRLQNVALAAATVAMPVLQAGVTTTGRTAMGALGPALRLPGAARVPQMALGFTANYLLPGYVLSSDAAVVNEALNATNLERKWRAFQDLPPEEQQYWAMKAGVTKPMNLATDDEKARALLVYSVPPDYSLTEWQQSLQQGMESMGKGADKLSAWVRRQTPASVAEPVVFAGNTVVGIAEGFGYTAQLPLVAGALSRRVPEGDAKVYAAMVAAGMVGFFTAIPGRFKADPIATSGRMVGLFVLTPKALVKYAKGIGVRLDPRFVAKRAVGAEFTTLRIHPPKGGAQIKAGELMQLTNRLVRQLVTEKGALARASIKTKAGEWVAEIRNTPYARVVSGSVFHFTPDITPFLKGAKVRVNKMELFASPQAAVRFAVTSARGKAMTRPGLVEIHMTKADLARAGLKKLLSKGEAEVEVVLRNGMELYSVPGFGGKGVSFDLRTGTFPIVRYTSAGARGWTGPTLKQLAQVRVEAAKAATGDFFLGWYGRQQAVKNALFRKDPAVARIDKAIKQLEQMTPEVMGPNGEIVTQRPHVPHPDGKGVMKSRAKALVHHPNQDAVLLMLDRSGDAFDLPGGSVDPLQILNSRGKWQRKPGKVTWGESVASQLKGETNVWMDNIKYLDLYTGKVHPHALSGARIFEAKATSANVDPVLAWNKYQRHKFGYETPEVSTFVWLHRNGTVSGPGVAQFQKVGMYPATLDILRVLQMRDGWKVSQKLAPIYRSTALNAARDQGFAIRVQKGQRIPEADIAKMNAKEIASLKAVRADKLKGETPSLVDFLNAEPDLTNLLELIEGRRRVVKTYTIANKTDPKVEAVVSRAGLWDKYEAALKGEPAQRAQKVAEVYDEALQMHLDQPRAQQAYRDALYSAARENLPGYAARYLHYYKRAIEAPTAPVERIRMEQRAAGRTAVATYSQLYRVSSEPYRGQYTPVPATVTPRRATPDDDTKKYTTPTKTTDSTITTKKTTTTTTIVKDNYPPTPGPRTVLPKQPTDDDNARKRRGLASDDKSKRRQEPTGRVQWRQGAYWVMVEPPAVEGEVHKNVQYSRRPFWGVRKVNGSPEETFAYQGNPPKKFLYEMGVTSIDIHSREKPHLRYRATGVGRRRRPRRRGRVI